MKKPLKPVPEALEPKREERKEARLTPAQRKKVEQREARRRR